MIAPVPPKEIVVHMQVAALLRHRGRTDWLWTHFASGELRDPHTGHKLKQMGLKTGWPDFILLSPDHVVHFLEVKREGERLSADQETFRLWCLQHGVPFVVAYDLDQARVAFNTWGCLRDDYTQQFRSGDAAE